ncbi:hypothetical protein [Metapseudomonas resinovorans]|uniref:hypothetical protein n=1 Tax=Metapseudomonas resinovorans TaxID=53412 RepID=UPI00048B5068|nr:hypothetical protein [Pseudomonas resinovorans]
MIQYLATDQRSLAQIADLLGERTFRLVRAQTQRVSIDVAGSEPSETIQPQDELEVGKRHINRRAPIVRQSGGESWIWRK